MSPSMEPVTKNSSCGSSAMHLMVLSCACREGKRGISIKILYTLSLSVFTYLIAMPQCALSHIKDANIAAFAARDEHLMLWCKDQTR